MSPRLDLLWRAGATPSATAIETPDGTWTFATLADAALRCATIVLSRADDARPVAVLLPSDERFVIWLHGVTLAGRAALLLNGRLTASEIAVQLLDAGVACLVTATDDARVDELKRLVPALCVMTVPGSVGLHGVREALPAALGPDAAASAGSGFPYAILYTSGTSGRARGACLSRENFEASATAAADRLGAVVAQRWLACMPLFHVGGLSILTRSVIFGSPVRLMPRFDAAPVSDALDSGDIAGVSLVPTMLSRLIAHRGERRAPEGLRALLLGGAPASSELLSRACALGYPVCPTYGLTEATSQVATAEPPAPGAASPSPMRPLQGLELRIVSDGGVDAGPGVPGEIVVRGPTVMTGYLNDAESTARALRAGWLHTGDVGCIGADGGLRVLDRRDDLIVSGGENVYPAEVEAVLLDLPSVADAGVTGIPDDDLGARVVAWIVAEHGKTLTAEALSVHCTQRLAGYKRPREFRLVATLPRNAAGKLLRRKLVECL